MLRVESGMVKTIYGIVCIYFSSLRYDSYSETRLVDSIPGWRDQTFCGGFQLPIQNHHHVTIICLWLSFANTMNRYKFGDMQNERPWSTYLTPGYTWWLKKQYRNKSMLEIWPHKIKVVAVVASPLWIEEKYDTIQWFKGEGKTKHRRENREFFEAYDHE
jgi:hypothetical protein